MPLTSLLLEYGISKPFLFIEYTDNNHYINPSPSAPGPVGNPSFKATANDIVKVTWMQPSYPNGIILRYLISVDYYDGGGQLTSQAVDGNQTFSVTITSNLLGV